jgi:hypothetical protein
MLPYCKENNDTVLEIVRLSGVGASQAVHTKGSVEAVTQLQ